MTAAGIDQMDGTKSEWEREGERETERERDVSICERESEIHVK